MAGKHVTVRDDFRGGNPGNAGQLLLMPPVFPGSKIDKAYAEGRMAHKNGLVSGDNPYTQNDPVYGDLHNAWHNGIVNGAVNDGLNDESSRIQTGLNVNDP